MLAFFSAGLLLTARAASLPAPWTGQDIGAVGINGSDNYAANTSTLTLAASGTDITGTSDAFRYVSQPVTGSFRIVARVASLGNTDPWSKAGVMIRVTKAADSANAALVATPGNGVSFQWRASAGGGTSVMSNSSPKAPCWLQLARSGNTFTASQSPDGVTWTQVGTATIPMAANVSAGLAATSHNNSVLNTAVIDNVHTSVLSRAEIAAGARGLYFDKKSCVPEPLPAYAEVQNKLPNPILDSRPELVSMYWKCWQLAFSHLRQPQAGSAFVSNYIDAAFSSNIFQWDTVFMMMFARYGHAEFPAIQSLDNFYARQHPGGFICREIQSDGTDTYTDGPVNAVNPPLFSWAEVESYQLTGDKSRFAEVLPALEKYVNWLNTDGDSTNYNNLPDWSNHGRRTARAVHQLYWNTGFGSGMDNTPRNGNGWVDMSCQMVMQYNNLATICDELKLPAKASAFRKQAADIGARINKWCWNEQDGFYYDVQNDGTQYKVKTSGGFWPMIAGIASPAQCARLVAHLQNASEFWRPFVFPALAANEPQYQSSGGYWRGGVWAPTNFMIVKGLEQCGYEDFATQATDKYLTAMATVFANTGTVWENYAPELPLRPGSPAKGDFVGWTGDGPIALLIENMLGFRGDGVDHRLTWRLTRIDRHGIQRLHVGNATITAICAARSDVNAPAQLTVTSDQPFTLIVSKNGRNTSLTVPAGTTNFTAP